MAHLSFEMVSFPIALSTSPSSSVSIIFHVGFTCVFPVLLTGIEKSILNSHCSVSPSSVGGSSTGPKHFPSYLLGVKSHSGHISDIFSQSQQVPSYILSDVSFHSQASYLGSLHPDHPQIVGSSISTPTITSHDTFTNIMIP